MLLWPCGRTGCHGVALTTRTHARSRLQSPLRILSDAPKFRAECLQTLRDGEVEEESAAPPSIDATIRRRRAIPLHDSMNISRPRVGVENTLAR